MTEVSRYLWVPRYRLRSEILITGKVGYHRAKPGCQVPGFRSPPYLRPAWVSRYPGTGDPTLNVQYQTISCPKYHVKNCYIYLKCFRYSDMEDFFSYIHYAGFRTICELKLPFISIHISCPGSFEIYFSKICLDGCQ